MFTISFSFTHAFKRNAWLPSMTSHVLHDQYKCLNTGVIIVSFSLQFPPHRKRIKENGQKKWTRMKCF